LITLVALLFVLTTKVEGKSALPPCVGTEVANWSNCVGIDKSNEERFVYEGEFLKGNYHGKGTLIVNQKDFKGDKYVGEFKNGKRHGKGTYTSASGYKYVGDFKDDKYDGKGSFDFANGDKYVGQFKDGKKNGQGTYFYSKGGKYVGMFKDDEFVAENSSNEKTHTGKRLSVSGKPQDEAYCAFLGDTRVPDKKCLGEDPKNHTTIIKTSYAINFDFVIKRTDSPTLCKTAEFVKPLLNFLESKNIPYKQNYFDGSCNYKFELATKEDLCSQEGKNLFKNGGGATITTQDLTKAGNTNARNTSISEVCI
jgi:hypothetical protein